MTKKEEFEKFLKDELLVTKSNIVTDKLWSWIENEIRQAKIDENERNAEMFISLPEGDFRDFDIADILRRRNIELEKEKI